MALGLINLNSKEDLGKLTKEQLVDLVISGRKDLESVKDKILNYSEEELLAYQKELKGIRAAAEVFVALCGVKNG